MLNTSTASIQRRGTRSKSLRSGTGRPNSGGSGKPRKSMATMSVASDTPQIRMDPDDDEISFIRRKFQDVEERRLKEWENYQRSNRTTIDEMNPTVFMDINVADTPAGRLVIELFEDVVPETTNNFRALITGTNHYDADTGIKLDYFETSAKRVEKDVGIHLGELQNRSISSQGVNLREENFAKLHTERGLLTMVSRGPHQVGSAFMITLGPAPQLDYLQVVFGRVIDGMSVLEKMEKVETNRIGVPSAPVTIGFCGALTGTKPTGIHVPPEEKDLPSPTLAASDQPADTSSAMETPADLALANSQATVTTTSGDPHSVPERPLTAGSDTSDAPPHRTGTLTHNSDGQALSPTSGDEESDEGEPQTEDSTAEAAKVDSGAEEDGIPVVAEGGAAQEEDQAAPAAKVEK